ncbi:hypothetical protein BSKO_00328 [Bryopsis sp. KO-2023]|nr:hypothetical protein BSKO_00328 [Bryopsis sp. KO-2023]
MGLILLKRPHAIDPASKLNLAISDVRRLAGGRAFTTFASFGNREREVSGVFLIWEASFFDRRPVRIYIPGFRTRVVRSFKVVVVPEDWNSMLTPEFPVQELPLHPWPVPSRFQCLGSIPFKDFWEHGDLHDEAGMEEAAHQIHNLLGELCELGPSDLLTHKVMQCLKATAASEHLHIAHLLSALGCRLNSFNCQADAENVHRRALCVATKALGQDHPELASCMEWLAFSLYCQGNFKEAVLLCYSTMVLVSNSAGPLHPNMANCYFNLATVLEAMSLFEHSGVLRMKGHSILQLLYEPYRCYPVPSTPATLPNEEGWVEDQNCVLDSPTSAFKEEKMTVYHQDFYHPYPVGFVPVGVEAGLTGSLPPGLGYLGCDPGNEILSAGSEESSSTLEPKICDPLPLEGH